MNSLRIYVFLALLVIPIGIISINDSAFAQYTNYKVAAGGGNDTNVLMTYIPRSLSINIGDSVTWYNPTEVGEPHTITFIMDKSYFPPPAVPFNVSNTTSFNPVILNPNVEPLIIPNNEKQGRHNNVKTTIIVDNARVYNPTIIDSTGNNITTLLPNSNYVMIGDEKYINSGWMLPEGMIPPGMAPITKFTVTFEKPGTYNYLCIIHPWMTGSIVVKES